MISAPTYSKTLRHRHNDDSTKVGAEQTAFIREMMAREAKTSRVPFSQAISLMDESGSLGGVIPTKEGWRHLCNEIAPGLYSFMMGWENQGLPVEEVHKIQRTTFNTAYEARRNDLKNHRVTLYEANGLTRMEAIVSPKYALINTLDIMREIPKNFGSDIQLSTMMVKGRQFGATFINPTMRRTFVSERAQEGEVVDLGYQIQNSEDRSLTVGINVCAYLQHCTNGMRSTRDIHSVNARHIGNGLQLGRNLSKLNIGDMTGIIDLVAESSSVRLDDGTMKTHQNWVVRKSSKEFGESVVSPKVSYRGAHGRAAYPTVFDVFNAITERAHQDNALDVDRSMQMEGLGYDYIRYAMS